ncbi:sacsin-like [Mytilus californianus]|uniref:sacsin-like n=1 Tax=Mytilus californianus TaxID=6549 RepID=UPI002247694B|nr:sacsin-like [Mytilus californianus]
MEEESDESSDDEVQYSEMLQPPLINQLKKILDEYPDDGQILKEIIQNAEDAEASLMKVLYDDRKINQDISSTKKQYFKKYFKGPALCIYNNAIFTESDWCGIRMIYSSVKEFDPVKVGRFGLGFKSVFHITDYPMIISGNQLLILDPHQKLSDRVCIKMKLNKMRKYKRMDVTDCLAAFEGMFGFSTETIEKGNFKGTLFRFPLREVKTELSENIYDEIKVMDLFKAFKAEAPVELLFLKCLERIDLYWKFTDLERDQDYGDSPVYSVNISDSCVQSVRDGRIHVMNHLKTYGKMLANKTFRINYRMTVETLNEGDIHTNEWIIFHCMKGGNMSEELRILSLDESLSYSPYTSIAVPMEEDQFRGHVFCLMPLPLTDNSLTGLPVHVNGYFALSQNRRHVKWPTADQMKQGTYKDKSLRWNNCLITEVLADLYYNVILELIEHTITPDSVAIVTRTIPDCRQITEHWKNILKPLFDSLFESKFLFTENNGGCWISIKEAVFDVFEADTNSDVKRSVLEFLLLNNENIVHSEEKILFAIERKGIEIVSITGKLVAAAAIMNPSNLNSSPESDKMNILQFLLSCEDQSILQGVPLLPLHNGCFAEFDHTSNDMVFVSQNVTELFPGLEEKFIKQDLQKEIYDNLLNICTKGLFQLHKFSRSTDKEIAGLLRTTIQKNIGTTTLERLAWKTTNGRTNETWLKKVWKLLKDRQFDLGFFKDLFIVPIISGENLLLDDSKEAILCKLSKQFIIKSSKDFKELPDGVCRCLSLLDIVILPAMWGDISEHPDIDQYVFKPTVYNVCRLLEAVSVNSCRDELIETFNQECTPGDRDDFVSFMSVIESVHCRAAEVLSSLKLFKERITSRFVSRNEVGLIVHTEDLPVQYFVENIDVSNKEHYNFSVALEMNEIEFNSAGVNVLKYLKNDIGCYSEIDQRNVLQYVLTHLKRFPSKVLILEECKNIRFVYDNKGRRKCACEYFDPEDEGLKLILVEDDFPDVKKTNIDLKYLRKLGIKSVNDLTENHIIRCAKEIHDKCTNGRCSDIDFARSSKIMELLSSRPELVTDVICDYHFVEPVKKPCSFPYVLKWFHPQFAFCKPNDLLDEKHQKLVGCVLPLVNSSECASLATKCSWNKTPDVKNVIVQLLIIAYSYEDIYKPQLLPLISDIFHFLVDNYGSFSKEALEEFKNKEWIWVGSKFVRSNQIYFSKDEHPVINFEPYLYTLPGEFQLKKFKTFFTETKFCLSGNHSDLCVEVLKLIKKKHDTSEVNEKDTTEDLQLVVKILNILKEEDGIEHDDILFPVHTEKANKLVLQPASKCNYCNEDWLKDSADEDGNDIFYVHHDIPMDTAVKLGVPSLTDRLLQNTEWLEEWGQCEPLTTRLKTLLKEYKDGFSVFKELIQNADDAGATEVCFLYDERQNKNARTRLIDKGMVECQGPALWSFNDAQFSQGDLENITKLNGATKELDTTKIGRFGLGFCSVYNLTEVPSFISGNHIVIFDPHTKYLGTALRNKRQPGVKINISKNRSMLKTMCTQFLPFEGVFDCNLTVSQDRKLSYKGTLFRFPLRTKQQAEQSEISHTVYDKHEMVRLLNMFTESGGNLLLFTQNVMSVELYFLPDDGRSPVESKLVFRTERKMKQTIEMPIKSMFEENVTTVLQSMSIVKHQHQSTKNQKNFPLLFSAIFDISIFSSAEDELGIKEYSSNTKWIITWERGTSSSWNMSINNSEKGVLAVASIACPVEVVDGKIRTINFESLPVGFYKTSHVFCFLPLPLETNLPVHINGYFAVTADRQRLCSDSTDDKSSFESIWNKELMQDAVCNAYVKFLEDLQNSKISPTEAYFERWPTEIIKNSKDNFWILQRMVYNHICRSKCRVFRTGGSRCVSLDECAFLHPDIAESNFCDVVLEACEKIHWKDILIKIPRNILRCFINAECESFISRKMISIFHLYKQVILPNFVDTIWDGKRDGVIIFALNSCNDDILFLLNEYPCIPTEPHGKLKCPNEIVDRNGSVSCLFDIDDERFVCLSSALNTFDKLFTTKGLGVITNTLTPYLIIDRARSVKVKAKTCTGCAIERCINFLEYITKNSTFLIPHKSMLETEEFLPCMRQPKSWKFTWAGNKETNLNTVVQSCGNQNHSIMEPVLFEGLNKLHLSDCYCLVGTTMFVLDKQISELFLNVLTKIGVKTRNTLDVEHVLANLKNIAKESKKIDINDQVVETLHTVTMEIYRYFNFILENDTVGKERLNNILEEINQYPMIFLNDTFLSPVEVFEEVAHDCRPYFYSLQNAPHLKYFKYFLKCIGIRRDVDVNSILGVLAKFQNQYESSKLPNSDITVYINLLLQLAHSMQIEQISPTSLPILMAPDNENVLTLTKFLCVQETEVYTRQAMKFTHDLISPALASSLGILSKRKMKLRLCSRTRRFGQREELTTRIKGILDGYPCDSGVLKELVQNADDAKASEIHIVADFNHYPSDKLFDESWKPLQGPALLIYNDSAFSEQDLNGIQDLGIGSKRMDPTKTGQYGVGFNVVYHLTDVPSFLTKGPEVESGQILCVLDPNCRYVPGATPSVPGIEYIQLEELWEDFSDVFECYHSNLLLKEKGTIFRLPLRTTSFAMQSKLKKTSVDENYVRNILDLFVKDLPDILLFVSNVEKITISEIVDNSLQEIYSVNIKKSNLEGRQQFFENVYQTADIVSKSDSYYQVNPSDVLYEATVDDSNGIEKSWLIVNGLGFKETSKIKKNVTTAFRNRELNLMPRGGIAIDITQTEHADEKIEGKSYCFLPLENPTGLPIHFNGHFVLDHQTRRNLLDEDRESYRSCWNKLILDQIVAPCYVSALVFLQKRIKPTKTSRLSDTETTLNLSFFHSIFPNITKAKNNYVEYLICCVYNYIHKSNVELFAISFDKTIRFVSLRNTRDEFEAVWNNLQFDKTSFPFSTQIQGITKLFSKCGKTPMIVDICRSLGVHLVDTPMFVLESMRLSGLKVQTISPTFLIMFMKSVDIMKGETQIELHKSQFLTLDRLLTCLEYCQKDENFKNKILGLPLCLRQDKMIQKFDIEKAVFHTKFFDLLPESASQFLHGKLVNRITGDRIHGLKTFTLNDFIEWLPYTVSLEKYRTIDQAVEWNPESSQIPTRSWIENVWCFIKGEMQSCDRRVWKQFLPWCLIPCKIEYEQSFTYVGHRFYNKIYSEKAIKTDQKKCENLLYPLGDFKAILDIHSFHGALAQALNSLKLPVLDTKNTLLMSLTPSIKSCTGVLECLYLNREKLKKRHCTLHSEHCTVILEFLSECFNGPCGQQVKPEIITWVKEIPIHVTISGYVTSLTNKKRILVVPIDMLTDGIDIWAKMTQTTLLKDNYKLHNVFKAINLSSGSICNAYAMYILPSFESLPVENRESHLVYIRDKLLARPGSGNYTNDQKVLISQLIQTQIIPDRTGRLQTAKYFYSPFNEVMMALADESQFPCQQFNDYEWKDFLELAGIRKDITIDMFVEFAESVAAKRYLFYFTDLQHKSEMLLCHILETTQLIQEGLLRKIANIPFIVPYKVERKKTNIYRQHNIDQLICFAGAVLTKHADLSWTCCPILPEIASRIAVIAGNARNQLNIYYKLDCHHVVSHIQNIVDELKIKGDKQKIRMDDICFIMQLMDKFYKWLDENIEREATISKRLQQKPIVFLPKHMIFVNCSRIVQQLCLDGEMPRYLSQVPREYGQYGQVFEKIGMRPKVSCYHFAKTLEYLFIDVIKEELNENEFRVVTKCLLGMINEITRENCDANINKSLSDVHHLYLPTRNKKLENASTLIYSDNSDWERFVHSEAETTQFVIDLKAIDIYGANGMVLFNSLPTRMRPKILSQLIHERLNTGMLEHIENMVCKQLSNMIQTDEFCEGFIRIIADSQQKSASKLIDLANAEQLVKDIRQIPIISVKTVSLDLLYHNITVASIEKDSFFDKQDKTLYCAIPQNETIELWLTNNSNVFQEAFKHCTNYMYTWQERLLLKMMCNLRNVERISSMLDNERVTRYEVAFTQSVFQNPGVTVHPKWHCWLENGFSEFENGETVALLVHDAIEENGRIIPAQYTYAKIRKKIKSQVYDSTIATVWLQRYDVEVSIGRFKTLSAHRLYKFTRNTKPCVELVPAVEVPKMNNRPESKQSAIEETEKFVNLIYTLDTEEERRSMIKRFYMAHHPDRSMQEETTAKEVFIHFQQLIKEKEETCRNSMYYRQFSSWDRVTHSQFQGQYQHLQSSQTRPTHHTLSSQSAQTRAIPLPHHYPQQRPITGFQRHVVETVPSPQEARLWFRQAKDDFDVASKVYENSKQDRAFNWICFLCYQSTEKALKAFHYNKDSNNIPSTSNLYSLAKGFEEDFKSIVTKLADLIGQQEDMMYPERSNAATPTELYTRPMAGTSIRLTSEILEYINSRL